MVLDARKALKGKPVIVAVNISNLMVFSEFEKEADAILCVFGVQEQALIDIIAGASEPSGSPPRKCRRIGRPWKSGKRASLLI